MEFKDLAPYQDAFESYLLRENLEQNKPEALFTPIKYVMSMGGKRIRPILTLLAYQLFDRDFERALPQALAVEVFHNFTLVHDDIMDMAPTRRGVETIHEKFGTNPAILSGDAMLIMSYQYLTRKLAKTQIGPAVDLFSGTALDICRGQQMDMDFENEDHVTLDQYLLMIKYKTAVLLGLALALGGVVAGATDESIQRLKECGIAAGMAFQVHDDYLDAFGDATVTGKQRGGDIIQNKKTYLWTKAYEIGGDRIRQELTHWYSQTDVNPEVKVRRVLELFQSLDIESYCRQLQLKYTDKAVDALNALDTSVDSKQKIFDLMALLLSRSH